MRLNRYNPIFTLYEKKGHAAVRIIKLVSPDGWDLSSLASLRLEVVDQHGLSLLSKPLADYPREETERQEIKVEEQFAVRDHLTVRVASGEEELNFEVEVHNS